ncbi:hypothetical protein E8L90_06570 [Brevibacillus antibioticus]|uniref:Uncharacterized protein n=1 Tax=Brevibacillus antibioticus TaxID=2570228 RepID=A0A4U2Y3S6_9BACL|nr:hypothetical protein [Brevibacillus antibioticus]TKI55140.1 hypothetical protein E8L90_06570 [Brevibacillus antibioticus]
MKKITSTLLALSVVGMSIFSNFAVIPTTFAKSSKADEKIPQPKFDSYKIELNDGYKIVSESVRINKNDDFIETSVYSREDFFDNDDNYQNTVLEISSFYNDFETGEAKNKFLTKTVHDEKGIMKLSSKKYVSFENAEFEEEIGRYFEGEEGLFDKIEGYTLEDVKEEKETINKEIEKNNDSIGMAVLARGAFDNYYNHDNKSGDFEIQALSASAREYIRVTGNEDDGDNSKSLSNFKSYIRAYEDAVITKMDREEFRDEVNAWAGGISAFLTIGQYGGDALKGPAGWVKGVKYLGKSFMIAKIALWTTQAYASGAVLGYSNIAAENLDDARKELNYRNWTKVKMKTVSGY